MNIAIIGGTRNSKRLAATFSEKGHQVLLAEKGDHPGPDPFLSSLEDVYYCSIEEAARIADFIIITAPAADVREIAYWLGDVRKKVIIDMSYSNGPGRQDYINTVRAINVIAGTTDVVKAVCIHGFDHLFSPLLGKQKAELLLAGDSLRAKEIAKIIMKEGGVTHFFDFGGSETYHLLDEASQCVSSVMAVRSKSRTGLVV
jgi:predicted dinucleotide-binding enzyme